VAAAAPSPSAGIVTVRKISSIVALGLTAIFAAPAHAQTIPPPSAQRQLYIYDKAGKTIESLTPNYDHYEVFDFAHRYKAVGYARMLGQRLIIYDLDNNIVATARAELLPPDSNLRDITTVRDRRGRPIGTLARY
jgi:hypothetical protein